MMRRIIGRRRIENEDWSITMKRMNDRLDQKQRLFDCEPWSIRFARNQWRYSQRLMESYPLLWARVMCKVMPILQTIRNPTFFLIDLPDIHKCDGMTPSIYFVIKFGHDFEENAGSIFSVILTSPVTKMNICFTLPISEGSF